MIRVAIMDGHPVARYGLRSMLAGMSDMVVVAAVGEPAQLPRPDHGGADVLICDPFPVGEPPTLNAVRLWSAWVPVLVMSAARQPAHVLAAMQAGARGYLTKHASGDVLAAAVRSVAAGEPVVPAQASPAVVFGGRHYALAGRAVLSQREQQALAYIARGFTHQQTATRMGVSKATVDTYVARIRTKLRVGNKAELALAALSQVAPHHRERAAISR
jgi:two-component system, NarL family, nitrate/nitrite response regulator NarL